MVPLALVLGAVPAGAVGNGDGENGADAASIVRGPDDVLLFPAPDPAAVREAPRSTMPLFRGQYALCVFPPDELDREEAEMRRLQ